jgi:hypothetical protein
MKRPATTPLRNRHTVGTCGTPECDGEARLYPCGWRCTRHAPAEHRHLAVAA